MQHSKKPHSIASKIPLTSEEYQTTKVCLTLLSFRIIHGKWTGTSLEINIKSNFQGNMKNKDNSISILFTGSKLIQSEKVDDYDLSKLIVSDIFSFSNLQSSLDKYET